MRDPPAPTRPGARVLAERPLRRKHKHLIDRGRTHVDIGVAGFHPHMFACGLRSLDRRALALTSAALSVCGEGKHESDRQHTRERHGAGYRCVHGR